MERTRCVGADGSNILTSHLLLLSENRGRSSSSHLLPFLISMFPKLPIPLRLGHCNPDYLFFWWGGGGHVVLQQ